MPCCQRGSKGGVGWALSALLAASGGCVHAPGMQHRVQTAEEVAAGEAPLLAALHAEQPAVRAAAVYLVGWAGDARHVDAVGPLVDAEDAPTKRAAVAALSCLASGDPAAATAAVPYLLRTLHAGSSTLRADACLALSGCQFTDDSDLQACLADAALLDPLEGSSYPDLQFAVDQTRQRLAAIAAGLDRSWRTPAQAVEDRFHELASAAHRRLRAAPWVEIDRGELLARAAQTRLVLFGETHFEAGPLRDAQCQLLRDFAGSDPAHLAVGFEPPVESAQRQVLQFARQLGLQTIPLEQDWRQLSAESRYGARDDLAAATIRGFLDADPKHRLFVVRGETHVLPGSYLMRQLPTDALLILYGDGSSAVPLRFLGANTEATGRAFRVDVDPPCFVWCCSGKPRGNDQTELEAWLQRHDPMQDDRGEGPAQSNQEQRSQSHEDAARVALYASTAPQQAAPILPAFARGPVRGAGPASRSSRIAIEDP